MKVFRLDLGGNPLIANKEYIIETLATELDELGIGIEPITIEALEMSQNEIDSLPEWDGP